LSATINHTTQQTLPVMEHFYTLQGEGYHQGKAAYFIRLGGYFIRLGGCDVGCVWCDVKESWDADKHPKYSLDEIVSMVENGTSENNQSNDDVIVVITGGEPLMHPLNELTFALQQKGFATNIETSGSSPLSGHWNWICLSPKKFKAPLTEVCEKADELKVVVFNKSDFDWAEKYAALVKPSCLLYLQPEWDKASIVTPLIIEYVKQNPQWRLSLQIHKYINVP